MTSRYLPEGTVALIDRSKIPRLFGGVGVTQIAMDFTQEYPGPGWPTDE